MYIHVFQNTTIGQPDYAQSTEFDDGAYITIQAQICAIKQVKSKYLCA